MNSLPSKYKFRITGSILPKPENEYVDLIQDWFKANVPVEQKTTDFIVYPRFVVQRNNVGAPGTYEEEIIYPPRRRTVIGGLNDMEDLTYNATASMIRKLEKTGVNVVQNTTATIPFIAQKDVAPKGKRYMKPIPYGYPTELELCSSTIFKGVNLLAYKKLFSQRQNIKVGIVFKIMHTYQLGNAAPSSTRKPHDPFRYIKDIQELSGYSIVESRMLYITARSYKSFVRQVADRRRVAGNHITKESGEELFVSLLPYKVEIITDIRDIKLNRFYIETPNEEVVATKNGYCVMRLLTKALKLTNLDDDGISKQVRKQFIKLFGADGIKDGITTNMLLKWNKETGERCSFHIYSPCLQLVERYYAPKNKQRCSIAAIINDAHIYDANDCNMNTEASSVFSLGFKELPGKYEVYYWSDDESARAQWITSNCIIICIDPDIQAREFAASLCKKNKINYVLENNSIITENSINIIFDDRTYFERCDIAKELFDKYKCSNFDIEVHPRMHPIHLYTSLLKYHSGQHKVKSSFNDELYDLFTTYKTQAPIHCFKPHTGCWDMPKCYPNTQREFIDNISVFDELCYTDEWDGVFREGFYLVDPFELGEFVSEHRSWEVMCTTKWLVEECNLPRDKIIGYARPSYVVDKTYFKQTIDDLLANDTHIQTKKNMLVIANGLNGKHTVDVKRHFTTTDKDTMLATLAEACKNYSNSTLDYHEIDGFYFATVHDVRKKDTNTLPLYMQTVSEAKLRLFKIVKWLVDNGYEVYGYKTDSIHTNYEPTVNFVDLLDSKYEDNYPNDYVETAIPGVYAHKTHMRAAIIEHPTDEIAGFTVKWKALESIIIPEKHNRIYESLKLKKTIWNEYGRDKNLSELSGFMITGIAGSGKTYKLTNETTNDYNLALTHAVKNLLPNGRTFKSAFQDIPMNKRIWVDECYMLSRKSLCMLYKAYKRGCVIRLSGDYRQGLPMDGEFRKLTNNPVIAEMCNNNLVSLEYLPGLRYDEQTYDLVSAFEQSCDINVLADYMNKPVDPHALAITAFKNHNNQHARINESDGYTLEVGAEVRLCTNIYYARDNSLYNGALGRVESITEDGIKLEGHDTIIKNCNSHIELAHCITVIREQGRTETRPVTVYAEGMNMNQLYTAITRIKTLDNLNIVYNGKPIFQWAPESRDVILRKPSEKRMIKLNEITLGGKKHIVMHHGSKDTAEEEFLLSREIHSSTYEKKIIKALVKTQGCAKKSPVRNYNNFWIVVKDGTTVTTSKRVYGGKVCNRNKKFYPEYPVGTVITSEMAKLSSENYEAQLF